MKLNLALLVCLIIQVNFVFSQGCFEKCDSDLRNSKLSFPDANNKIIADLIGCKAPNFDVVTLNGEHLKLSDLAGKVVVINFWYTSCPPCLAEMPALNQLVEDFQKTDVTFIAFARNDEDALKPFLKLRQFDYKIVTSQYDISDKYCIVAGWPMNMVIDKNGVVKEIFAGGYTDERAKKHAYNRMKPVIEAALFSK
jgi:peroxiredoxin